MPLPPDFPQSPYAILDPEKRWLPDDGLLTKSGFKMPPLVEKLRRAVKEFRDNDYQGASQTSKSLLDWWFNNDNFIDTPDGDKRLFQYFFAQREAIETIIYLYEVKTVRDAVDLLRFDQTGSLSTNMFDESWLRFVIKMATGSGKTKVLSLVVAWSYFHKLYEKDSNLSRNFLIITPNIIVLDRLYRDFNNADIFYRDPVLPEQGWGGRDWQADFKVKIHKQDEVRTQNEVGNIFLTNIHRVYTGKENIPSADDENTKDYFYGTKAQSTEDKTDLGDIVRDVSELMVLNDEAHHIHNEKLSWFQSIRDIHNQLVQKGKSLSLQIDVTATPKHNNGNIFVQTICDYPLVEAIAQKIVKRPILPDDEDLKNLQEAPISRYVEKYADYIHLGFVQWQKTSESQANANKKPILFIMTDDTKNCDEVANFLEDDDRFNKRLKGKVLVIHTKKNGEISEASSKQNKKELEELRKLANEIDSGNNHYEAVVSVLMLKEGWDVRNVTTIVGLRSYSAQSNILPEQTLGRGLRRMYPDSHEPEELLSVIGTEAFIEFVRSIEKEGVTFERKKMGKNPNSPPIITIDWQNLDKDIDALDIEIPILSARNYYNLDKVKELTAKSLRYKKIKYKDYKPKEMQEIIFRDLITDEVKDVATLDVSQSLDYHGVIRYFANVIMKPLRLFSHFGFFYGEVKRFIQEDLFDKKIDFEDKETLRNILRNLSEPQARNTIVETFKNAVKKLVTDEKSHVIIEKHIKIKDTRPFPVKEQNYLKPEKSVFNMIIGDNSDLELEFADFLEKCPDIISYAKLYQAVGFKLDYIKSDGTMGNYYPDFIVKLPKNNFYIIETKGAVYADDLPKWQRLNQWCEDINEAQNNAKFACLFVSQDLFKRYKQSDFQSLIATFTGESPIPNQ